MAYGGVQPMLPYQAIITTCFHFVLKVPNKKIVRSALNTLRKYRVQAT
jgi:hypothetical protein